MQKKRVRLCLLLWEITTIVVHLARVNPWLFIILLTIFLLNFCVYFFSNAGQGFKLLVCYNHIQYYIDMLSFTIKLCLYPWKIAWSQSHWTPIPNREILLVAFNTQKTCGYHSMVFPNETHETYFNMWTTSMRMKICGFRPTTWMNSDKWWMSNKTISSSTSRS